MIATAAELNDPAAMRTAGPELLSLALMDARNRSLALLAAFEEAGRDHCGHDEEQASPAWLVGELAWFQEAWIARNVQRRRGRGCDPRVARLSSIEPQADRWWDPREAPARRLDPGPLPDNGFIRQYLVDTLEVTLDLLHGSPADDDALHFFRAALFHEDLRHETLIEAAQNAGVALPDGLLRPDVPLPPAGTTFSLEQGRWTLGEPPGDGYRFEAELGQRTELLPPGEIDAQPVNWQRFLEFIADGGYRQRRWWTPEGWQWLSQRQRKAPRAIERTEPPAAMNRFGRLVRVRPLEAVQQISLHEALAWCRWAGRRLPGEAEWERAVSRFGRRGLRHGMVWEWTADVLAPLDPTQPCGWPGSVSDSGPFRPACGRHQVVRGGSRATRERLGGLHRRRHLDPDDDQAFCGFRTCSL